MRESTGIDGTAEQQQARMRASSSWAAQHQQSSSRHETHSHTGPMTPIMPRLLFLLYIWLPSTLPATPPLNIWPYPTGAISTSTTIATICTNLRIRCSTPPICPFSETLLWYEARIRGVNHFNYYSTTNTPLLSDVQVVVESQGTLGPNMNETHQIICTNVSCTVTAAEVVELFVAWKHGHIWCIPAAQSQ